jgi:hypothetical protein
MSDELEMAQQGIEHAHHAHEALGDPRARRVAVMIAMLAAALALADMAEKGAQNAYLTAHISLSDEWNFFQAKHVRSTVLSATAELLASLPNAATDPAIGKRIAQARATAARLEDDPQGGEGRKQLMAKAAHEAEQRDHQFHRYHKFELVVGALQIAIVLASVSVVTRIRQLAMAAALLGAASAVYGLLVWTGVV